MSNKRTIQVLIIDDQVHQSVLIQDFLSTAKGTSFVVDSANCYDTGLEKLLSKTYDVALIDYYIGNHNGLELLREAIDQGCITPAILMTGKGDHSIDMKAMRTGAVDYLDKTQLKPALLERSIRYAYEHAQASKALRQSEARFRTLVSTIPTGVVIIHNQRLQYANPVVEAFTQLSTEQLREIDPLQLVAPESREQLQALLEAFDAELIPPPRMEIKLLSASGKVYWFDLVSSAIEYQGQRSLLGSMIDITARKRAEQAEYEQRVLAEALLDITTALNSTLHLDEVLKRILNNVGRVVPHDTANILLIEDGSVRLAGHMGPSEQKPLLQDLHMLVSEAHTLHHIVHTERPVIVPDVRQNTMWNDFFPEYDIHSYISVPITLDDRVIGALELGAFTANFFAEHHAHWLSNFANQAAIAVRNARAYEQAQDLAAIEERQRLARDLHDAVSQTLFSANVIAETLPRLLDENPDEVRSDLVHLSRLTKGALAEMRTLLLELRPTALAQTSLSRLVSQLAESYASRTHARVVVDFQDEPDLPVNIRIGLYRIAQEAFNNIIKHAQASLVHVSVRSDIDRVYLEIRDNGHGFDPRTVAPDNLGLRIMRERAEAMGLTLTINTKIGLGTIVRVGWSHDERIERT